MTHTPGPWIDSPNTSDAIISKHPDAIEQAGQALRYYGGYVICESVTPRDKPLIKAAPEMWDLCVRFIAEIEQYVNEPGAVTSMNRLAENLASLYKDATVIHERVLGGK